MVLVATGDIPELDHDFVLAGSFGVSRGFLFKFKDAAAGGGSIVMPKWENYEIISDLLQMKLEMADLPEGLGPMIKIFRVIYRLDIFLIQIIVFFLNKFNSGFRFKCNKLNHYL